MNQEVKDRYAARVEDVEEGILDPLFVYAELKDLEKFFAECAAQIQDAALAEASKYDKPQFQHQGFQFTVGSGKTIYDYKNVPQWADIKARLARIEELSKQAAKMSVLTGGGTIVDEDGQVIPPCETRTGKGFLSVKPIQ